MKKKHILLVLSSLFIATTLTNCGGKSIDYGHTTKKVQFNNLEMGTSIPITMDFFNINPNVVYIPISNYQSYVPSFTMSVKRNGDMYTFKNLANNEKALLNAATGELSYDSFSKFTSYSNIPHVEIYYNGLLNGKLIEEETTYQSGNKYSINLSNYNLKPIKQDNEYYLPLDVLMRIDPLTNKGTAYYDGVEDVTLLYKSNIADYCGKKVTEYPKTFYEYSYNLFTFDVDLYYGLNGYSRPMRHNNNEPFTFNKDGAIKTFAKYKDTITSSASVNDFDIALNNMFNEIDDGGHTVVEKMSLASTLAKLDNTVERKITSDRFNSERTARSNAPDEQQLKKIIASFDADGNGSDDIGYVNISSFSVMNDNEDIRYVLPVANAMFNPKVNPNSRIKDIVIDLANNGGGATVAEGAMLSWICNGKAKQVLKDARDHSITTTVCQYDINMDGKYDECDYIPNDINVYILTDATFSAACALTFDTYMYTLSDAYKKLPRQNIKFIGQPNLGGACSITSSTLMPTGFSYHMSSNAVSVNWNDMNKTCDEIMTMSDGWTMDVSQITDRTGYINDKIVKSR